jgi:hypothetical protein
MSVTSSGVHPSPSIAWSAVYLGVNLIGRVDPARDIRAPSVFCGRRSQRVNLDVEHRRILAAIRHVVADCIPVAAVRMPGMVGIAIGLLMVGFIGICLAEPYSKMVRSISGADGLLTDPGVIRLLGWIELAAGAILLGVHLFRG